MISTRYIIVGRYSCPFCCMAIDLCTAKDLKTVFLNYESEQDILEDYKQYYKFETVPIILKNCLETGMVNFIGGYKQLVEHFSEEN